MVYGDYSSGLVIVRDQQVVGELGRGGNQSSFVLGQKHSITGQLISHPAREVQYLVGQQQAIGSPHFPRSVTVTQLAAVMGRELHDAPHSIPRHASPPFPRASDQDQDNASSLMPSEDILLQ